MSSLLSLGRSHFAFAVPDVAASVTAFCLKRSIPLTCHQAGTTAEAPAPMVGDVVRFVDVMRPVEMRKFHLFNLLCGVVPFTVHIIAWWYHYFN